MYYDFKVKIPKVKGKIYERTIKGVVYINYEYDRIYKPDKLSHRNDSRESAKNFIDILKGLYDKAVAFPL